LSPNNQAIPPKSKLEVENRRDKVKTPERLSRTVEKELKNILQMVFTESARIIL